MCGPKHSDGYKRSSNDRSQDAPTVCQLCCNTAEIIPTAEKHHLAILDIHI